METQRNFKIKSAEAVKETDRQAIYDDNLTRLNASVNHAKFQYSNIDLVRKRAGYIRHKAINGLEKYLIEFEANLEKNGGKVIWALDADEAVNEIYSLLKKHGINQITKSRSLIADEIELQKKLTEMGIAYDEVHPGEFILRKLDKRPVHPSSFLLDKNLSEIKKLFNGSFKSHDKQNVFDVHSIIRNQVREKLQATSASVVGADFIIADTGSVCITEDAGDAVLNSVLPKIQIVIAGIDKVIPSMVNLDTLLPLYATFSSGQRINTYNTIVSGPKQESEKDGPAEMYVVLIDNGRTNVLAQKFQRRALSCIDCGACHNACPVYRKIGGEAYNSTYTGPIGSVITPWMKGFEEYSHLSYASTLCGSCSETCPVMINLSDQLLYNRKDSVEMKNYTLPDRLVMELWHKNLKSRKWMDWLSPKWKNIFLKKLYGQKWGHLPEVSPKSFKQLWEERREGKI